MSLPAARAPERAAIQITDVDVLPTKAVASACHGSERVQRRLVSGIQFNPPIGRSRPTRFAPRYGHELRGADTPISISDADLTGSSGHDLDQSLDTVPNNFYANTQ